MAVPITWTVVLLHTVVGLTTFWDSITFLSFYVHILECLLHLWDYSDLM